MRAFLAIDLPEEVRAAVRERQERLRADFPKSKWVRPESMHLTLAFYGEIEEPQVQELSEALEPVFTAHERFELRLRGGGTFPPRRPARVVWIGVEAPERLAELQEEAFAASREVLDLDPPRHPFHAHVTLARARRPWRRRTVERFGEESKGPWGESFQVEEGVLSQSHLSPEGARYEALERFPLGR